MHTHFKISAFAALVLSLSVGENAWAQHHHGYGNQENSLTLICWGEGRKPTVDVDKDYVWDNRRGKFAPRTYVESGTREFDSQVQIELHDDWGRIHLTGSLSIMPTISGSNPRHSEKCSLV